MFVPSPLYLLTISTFCNICFLRLDVHGSSRQGLPHVIKSALWSALWQSYSVCYPWAGCGSTKSRLMTFSWPHAHSVILSRSRLPLQGLCHVLHYRPQVFFTPIHIYTNPHVFSATSKYIWTDMANSCLIVLHFPIIHGHSSMFVPIG